MVAAVPVALGLVYPGKEVFARIPEPQGEIELAVVWLSQGGPVFLLGYQVFHGVGNPGSVDVGNCLRVHNRVQKGLLLLGQGPAVIDGAANLLQGDGEGLHNVYRGYI